MTSRWTWHGGGIDAARLHYGEGDAPWIDLSTGINPHAWPGVEALEIDWRSLPGRGALAQLEEAAAACFGVDARHVCAVPGTEVGLRIAGGLIGGSARYVGPTYRTHGEMIPGSQPIAAEALAGERGTLVLANPNNPDGRVWSRDALLDLLGARAADAWLMLDEAFADTDPALSLAASIAEDARLLVFRSFGKFFGLAGVRLGFVLGPVAILDRLRSALGAWPVSAAALAIGTAAYRDRDWIETMRRRLPADAAALDVVLARHGHVAIGGSPLFRLIEVDDGMALFERLVRQAILTRPFAEQPRWLRIGLPGDAAARDRLDAALADG